MRSRLISAGEYDRLLKMQEREIIGWLQRTDYREDVDALAIKDLDDLETVDRIIAHNGDRTVRKLERIAGAKFRQVLAGTLRSNDAWNLKVLAEAIAGGKDPSAALRGYARKGTFDPMALASAKSIRDLAAMASRHVAMPKDAGTLQQFLDALPQPENVHPCLIDEQNITTLLRLKRDGIPPERIVGRLRKGTIPRQALREAANAKDVAAAVARLRSTKYGHALRAPSLARIEGELRQEAVRRIRRQSRTFPLGTELLINYLAEKELEHARLRVLIKGKRLGLDEGFIREHLVA